jgi:hypothetical protein
MPRRVSMHGFPSAQAAREVLPNTEDSAINPKMRLPGR